MENKKIYISILIILITIFSVFFVVQNYIINKPLLDKENNITKQDIKKEEIKTTNDLSLENSLKKYSTNSDFLKCKNIDKLDDYSCLSNIISTKIWTTKDSSFCDDMPSENTVLACKDMNLSSFAIKENDLTSCDNINDLVIEINCKLDVIIQDVINKKDISKCDILKDKEIINNCTDTSIFRLAKITKDKSWCERLEKSRQDFCINSMNEE